MKSDASPRAIILALVIAAISAVVVGGCAVVFADPAHASTKAPPCEVTGHLETSPGHVTAVFHVDAVCKEVSLLSWLAPDAHAGMPQTLYDRHSETDVAPGDYRWTISAPPEGCFVQDDLALPGGYTIDFILGGDHVCQPSTPTTTTTITPTTTSTSTSTSTTSPPGTAASTTAIPPSTGQKTATPTSSTPTEELAFSGGGELWALTLGALGLIGAGRWVEWRGKRRRARL